jgi:alkaline phosphatase D
MLGAEQRAWIYEQLNDSDATWQVLGQQVLIGRMYLPGALSTQQIDLAGFARLVRLATMASQGMPLGPEDAAFLAANQKLLAFPPLPYNADAWDAYEIERRNLLQTAKDAGKNLVVLAGDSHNAWANELVIGNEPCGVEFATSSVTSPGLEAVLGISAANAPATEAQVMSLIPNLKYSNLHDRGFLVMTFREEEASGEFIFVDDILGETYSILTQRGRTLRVKAGDNRFALS